MSAASWIASKLNRETAVVFTVFGLTGSTTVFLVRPTLKYIIQNSQLTSDIPPDASFTSGPNSYRALYVTVMSPTYTMLLISYGHLLGRGPYFTHFAFKMWSRLLPPSIRARWQPK